MKKNQKKAVILMNLGSPDSTSVKDVRKYLNEFLMDGKVIDIPFALRTILVKGIIVPFRAPKSAEAYSTIWTEKGSPLIQNTKELQYAVQEHLEEPVLIAMRYGNPSPKYTYDFIIEHYPEVNEVILFPLYPHFAMSSYETAVEYMKKTHKKHDYKFNLTTIKPYFDNPSYIDSLADSMQPYLIQEYDKILFSYHGIPSRHIRKSDATGCHCLKVTDCCNTPSKAHETCYRHQVFTTTKLVTQKLQIPESKYDISFQSRLGSGWLQPFTDIRLKELPKEGVKKLLIVCPAFVSDCLETLEEIEERGKEIFLEAGGESYQMIPCMNTNPLWVNSIVKFISDYNKGLKDMILI